jgi:arylsulfatase A-like enzyme
LPLQDISSEHTLINNRLSGEHSVQLFADAAIEFIESRKSENEPFLCYVAFNLPHDPRRAPREYHKRWDATPPPLPANFLPTHPFDNGALVLRDEELAPWPRTPEVVRQHLADYYAAIEFLDSQVGRILKSLDDTDQARNTLIVFASDHGLAIGSHGLFGKQSLYDHSMHSPVIFAGPGVPEDKRSDALCYLLDIFPTLGDLSHVAGPEGSEGESLVPVLEGRASSTRKSIFTAYAKSQRAVRDDRWKLIVYPEINKIQLFDLKSDPNETRDLSGDPDLSPEVQRLTALLRDWQRRTDDTQPLTSPNPKPAEFDFSKVKTTTPQKPKRSQ